MRTCASVVLDFKASMTELEAMTLPVLVDFRDLPGYRELEKPRRCRHSYPLCADCQCGSQYGSRQSSPCQSTQHAYGLTRRGSISLASAALWRSGRHERRCCYSGAMMEDQETKETEDHSLVAVGASLASEGNTEDHCLHLDNLAHCRCVACAGPRGSQDPHEIKTL